MATFRQPPPPPQPPQDPDDQYPLVKIAGLWPSRSGTALMGNIGREMDIEALERVIQAARMAERPLRFIVFDNSNKMGNNPRAPAYTLMATLGRVMQPQPAQTFYPDPDQPEGEEEAGGNDDTPAWVEPPQPPTQRPMPPRRATPPRR